MGGPRASCVAAQTRRGCAAHAAAGCGPGRGGLRRPTYRLPPPRRPQKLAAGGPACAVLQPPPARSPRDPLAGPAACRPRPSPELHHLPSSRSASGPSSLPSFRRGPPPPPPPWVASEEPSRLHALPDFKNKQAPSPPRGVSGAFAKPAPPEAGKFAGRARAGRACCHPLLETRQRRRASRPYSPPGERSPSLRVTPSPAMQCQDCTTLTHRLSSQLEEKKKRREREGERQQRRRRTRWRATKDCTTRGWERRAPSGWPARAARRRAGTSSTTSSAQLSLGGLSACKLRTAHFLRPNKAREASLNLRAAARVGDFQQTSPPLAEALATLHPKPRPEPSPHPMALL